MDQLQLDIGVTFRKKSTFWGPLVTIFFRGIIHPKVPSKNHDQKNHIWGQGKIDYGDLGHLI